MTYEEARKEADAYTERTDKGAFVYADNAIDGGFAWCTEWHYRRGSFQYLTPEEIVYSSLEGEYA